MKKTIGLSKSKINAFLQCPKRLWLEVHKHKLLEVTEATKFAFAVGHHVGDLARAQYPKGILVGHDDKLSAALSQTKQLTMSWIQTPIFEATFQHRSVLIRADLLLPWGGAWHMAEVKSSVEPKPYHLNDLAVQSWVATKAGIAVARATVRHINSSFIYPGGGNYRGLFVDASVREELRELIPQVPTWVRSARTTLSGKEPKRDIGEHCDAPFACPFKTYCRKLAGPQPRYPVGLLPGPKGKRLARALSADGIWDLKKAPADRIDGEQLARIHEATVTGRAFRDAVGARKIIAGWKYPRAYLDFETIGFAVPIWKGMKPYQQVPFQWSCHIERKDGAVEHREFLDLSGQDPSRACAEQLVRDLSACKTIVAYHASTEVGVIKRLAERYPDLRHQLNGMAACVRDLLPVVKEHYYHRDMKGSYSIKDVLPTVAPGMDYGGLGEVQDGMAAQRAYAEAIRQSTAASRKSDVDNSLRNYCALDSDAMIVVARILCQ